MALVTNTISEYTAAAGVTVDGVLLKDSCVSGSQVVLRPSADSTTAIQLQNAAGTSVLNIDATNQRVGIGTTGPGARLDVANVLGGGIGLRVSPTITLGGATGETFAQQNRPTFSATIDQTTSVQYVHSSAAYSSGSFNYNLLYGIQGIYRHDGSGTVTRADAVNVQMGMGSGGGTVQSLHGIVITSFKSSGTIDTLYGIKIGNQSSGTTNYSIYSEGGTMYHAGNVGIGTTGPTYSLSFGGNAARTVWMERHTTANTAGNALTVQAGGATAGATDKAGGDLKFYPGVSTGSAESGVQIYGCVAGASGTADRTQTLAIQVLGNKLAFFAATPVAKQTGCAVPTDLATCITAITALRTALNNYALTTVV